MATPSAPLENPLAEGILADRRPDPFVIVIFGASGDLTVRKLIPALFDLSSEGYFPQRFAIVGVARREKTDESFRAEMTEAIAPPSGQSKKNGQPGGDWENFVRRIFYHRMSFGDNDAYPALAERLKRIEADLGIASNRLYYLSTGPSQFSIILERLSESGLVAAGARGGAWRRVVIEKPFGRDLDSARSLNDVVAASEGASRIDERSRVQRR